ncbi:hypothetical protein VTO42DRAFT_5438 [Malbranchea cinnamomea]
MVLSRRDAVVACVGGFVAWGLLVRWLPVLRFVGYAFVLGTALASSTLGALVCLSVRETADPRIKPPAVAGTSIAFLADEHRWDIDARSYRESAVYQPVPLYPQSFIVSAALDELLQCVLGAFVSSWYASISKNQRFVNEVDRAIRAAIAQLRERLLSQDLVEILVSRIVPIVTAHFRDFDLAERAVRGKNLTRNVTEVEELDIAIASRYRDGNLHPAAAAVSHSDKNGAQQAHLRELVAKLLPQLLPPPLLSSRVVFVLVREIVACGVLFPLMELLADPDTWNQWIEAYGRAALHDRKTVRRLRAALDQHASPAPRSKRPQPFPRLVANASERDFERFIRAIRRCNNLSDARRFRNHVTSQLKRESMVEGQDPVYLRRLETGKRVLDQKVAKLSAANEQANARSSSPFDSSSYGYVSTPHDASLVDVLRNAAGLSYFMEYMDRLGLMSLVQFWIVVDGFRNPLEDDFGDDTPASTTTWTSADRNDVVLISENHLSKPELRVPAESRKVVKEFIAAGKNATAEQYRKARTVILTTQTAVLEEMQNKYFPGFKQSDLYYKYLASDEAAAAAAAAASSQQRDRPALNRSPASGGHERRSSQSSIHRTSSRSSQRPRDLRRSAKSTTDILSTASPLAAAEPHSARGSMDSDRAPLFDESLGPDLLESSTYSLGNDPQNGEADARVIEEMQAALNDIITEQPAESRADRSRIALSSPTNPFPPPRDTDSPRASLDVHRPDGGDQKGKPNILSLGLVHTPGRIGVFADNDLFPDEDKFLEDEYADPEESDDRKDLEEEILPADPGDLGLAEAISALTADIEKLQSQEAVVDTLLRKAELTNNTAELRILKKSKASLQREIRRKDLQRQQYIIQESDSSLYGRATIQIKSIMVGKDDDGREYALYLIEVHRKAGEQMPAASWAVPRRYSEFHELHHRLRAIYPSVRHLEFPRRRVMMKLQKDFLHKRRVALETYLQQLLLIPEVCRSRELRSFLSQRAILPTTEPPPREGESRDLVSRIYNSVADGMEDFLNNITVLDQLSIAGQNLISAATNQFQTPQPELGPEDSVTAAEAEAELNAFEDRELEPFVKPICDVFLEVFELNKGNNWLRGRAVVVVLHQLLGGTIERKIRETAKSLVEDAALAKYITQIKDTMFPGGKLRENRPRTLSERMETRADASVTLATLIPDLAASVVGRANAQQAARRIFTTLNNPRLNVHLVYTILDEMVQVLFGGGL